MMFGDYVSMPPSFQRKLAYRDVRLHGYRAFGERSGSAELTEDRAVVERRLDQAAGESDDGVARETLLKSEIPYGSSE